jgi:AcrR family transcriptional regulator
VTGASGGPDDGHRPAPAAERALVDGRSAIRDRNRNAVLDAVLALFSEDNLSPGPEEVALRAGLSARSVYRYFEDRDALSRAAIERQVERVLPLFRIPAIGQGDRVERIDRFVTVRLRLYDAVAATARATRMRATFDDVVRRQLEVTRAALLDQVERHFAAELGLFDPATRRSRVAAVDTLTQFESLDHCRLHLDLRPSDIRAMLTDTLATLLAP